MKKMSGKSLIVLPAVCLAVMLAGGCGGGAGSSAQNSWDGGRGAYAGAADMAMAETAVVETTAETAAAVSDAYAYDEEGTFGGAMPEMPVPAEEEANSSEDGQRAGRKLIRTVGLTVETTEFDTLLGNIRQTVESDGGYIEQSDVQGSSMSSSDSSRYAYLTVRVPSQKLDEFLSKMAEQSNITNRSENVQDVTLQYTDVESRKKSLTIEQERLWELLEQADSVESIIALESRLSEIRYQLEGFESQLRTYDNQVDYSTVHIDIHEVKVFTPTDPDSVLTRIQKGFKRNLEGVGTGFVDLFVWFVSSLPVIAVFLVLLAAVLSVIFALTRRGRKRSAGEKAEKKEKKTDSSENG